MNTFFLSLKTASRCWLLLGLAVSAPAAVPPIGSSPTAAVTRAQAVELLRANDPVAAAALFEARVAPGQDRDTRDRAIAHEWMSTAAYFFNHDEFASARLALARAAEAVTALTQRKGVSADLYPLYRNLGSLTESILRDRARALANYDLALQAANGSAQVAQSELAELQRQAKKTRDDDALAQARRNK